VNQFILLGQYSFFFNSTGYRTQGLPHAKASTLLVKLCPQPFFLAFFCFCFWDRVLLPFAWAGLKLTILFSDFWVDGNTDSHHMPILDNNPLNGTICGSFYAYILLRNVSNKFSCYV
jgi:hypothetical protein